MRIHDDRSLIESLQDPKGTGSDAIFTSKTLLIVDPDLDDHTAPPQGDIMIF